MPRDSLHLLAASAVGAAVVLAAQQVIRALGLGVRQPPAADGADDDGSGLWKPAPHPDWRPPEHQAPPWGDTEAGVVHSVDPALLPPDVIYPLVISAVVPRPIAFVSTQSAAGVGNLAPYSYFNAMAHAPPHVAVGFCASRLREHGRKDSLVNVLETGEFVVNLIGEWFVEAANHCCGNFDYGEDEMELSGLTPLASLRVAPPRVAESAVQMECKLRHTYEVKDSVGAVTTTIVIGEVVMLHVNDAVAGRSPSGKLVVDISRLRPMSRLGGNTYGRTAGLFDLPRPDRGPGKQPLAYTSSPR